MEFTEVVRRRRMVRQYQPDRPVPPALVSRLLERAVRAPSAGFTQGWGFLILDNEHDRERFWAAARPSRGGRERWLAGMRTAPLIIVVHSNEDAYRERYAQPDKGRADLPWAVPYWHVDAGFAALMMLLTAVDEGLGACFFGIPAERTEHYREAFEVPDEYQPTGAITLGYPAPDWRSSSLRRGRRSVPEVAHYGRWGQRC